MKERVHKVREFWAEGDYRSAIQMAAQGNGRELGDHRRAIQAGWAAVWNPGFYRRLGPNPNTLYRAGLAAMVTVYGLEPPPPESIRTLK